MAGISGRWICRESEITRALQGKFTTEGTIKHTLEGGLKSLINQGKRSIFNQF